MTTLLTEPTGVPNPASLVWIPHRIDSPQTHNAPKVTTNKTKIL
jgi:hypothetical protein